MFTSEGPEIDRALLLAKADELDHKITELTAIRDNLRHTAACPAPNHFECPTFLRLLHIAEKKQLGQRNKLGKNNIRSGVRKT